MVTAYSWHPRIDLNRPVWPMAQPILADELLSSWLVRNALAHGCSPLTLTNCVWPRSRIWCRDLDRGIDAIQIAPLARLAGCNAVDITACSLSPTVGLICSRVPTRTGTWPWILTRGYRNLRCSSGLQCCPECLSQQLPYYQISARLAWHTVCPLHRARLIDHCPRCLAPLQPHRLTPPDSTCGVCHQCGFRLAEVESSHACLDELLFQQAADSCLSTGGFLGNELVPTWEWFYWASMIVSFIRFASLRKLNSVEEVFSQFACPLPSPSCLGLPLEMLPVEDRALLLSCVWRIMSQGREVIEHTFKKHALCRSVLALPRGLVPPASVTALIASMHSGPVRSFTGRTNKTPRSRLAVTRMWMKLRRRFLRDG